MGLLDLLRPRVVLAAGGFGAPVDPQYADANFKTTVAGKTDAKYQFGEHKVNELNMFQRYQEVTEFDPYVFSGLIDLALALGKGFEPAIDERKMNNKEKKLSESELRKALNDAEDFCEEVDMQNVFTEAARLLCQDGTVALILSRADGEDKTDGILRIEFAPMPYVTLWPKGFDNANPGQTSQIMDGTLILRGPIDRVVLNEFTPWQKIFTDERFVLLRNSPQNYLMMDRYKRWCIGLYGRSLLEPIMDTIRYRQNLLHMNDQAMRRYGKLLLHFEYNALAELIATRQVSVEDAQKYINAAQKGIKSLQANEDIVTAGFEIQPIEAKGEWDIDTIKKSLEADIANALFGSSGSSGQSGLTFASAYVTRMHKIMGMESLRRVVKRGIEEIIYRHLIDKGYGEDIAKAIIINLDPINEPEIDPATIMQLNATGKISDRNMYNLFGWSFEPPSIEQQLEAQETQLELQSRYQMQVDTNKATSKPAAGGSSNGGSKPGPTKSASGPVKAAKRTEKSLYDKK